MEGVHAAAEETAIPHSPRDHGEQIVDNSTSMDQDAIDVKSNIEVATQPDPTADIPNTDDKDSGNSIAAPLPPNDQNADVSSHPPSQNLAVSADEPAATSSDIDQSAMSDAPIYGTRSRNRAGNARPNYAEDQDMDFEYTAVPKSDASRNPPANQTTTAPDTTFRKFISVNEFGQSEKSSSKDAIPGTSSFPAAPGKKRKAAGSAAQASQIPEAPTNGTSTTAVSRRTTRPSSVASNSQGGNMPSFDTTKRILKDGVLVADDGTTFAINDCVYLVCEPPGDPYYLGRIMEFIHENSGDASLPVVELRINWYYRPRDVMRYNYDTRLVYGTMHSDMQAISNLRGRCQVRHRSEIDNLDEYRKEKDSFWYSQIVDRFIKRYYEVVPTSQIINVPEKVKKALDERWKFIAVESSRAKELTSAVKLCKRCSGYCASHESVDCAICKSSYHMNCVRPPLPKKPSRGFAWACGPCSRAQEKRLEARHTPQLGLSPAEGEEELPEEEEEEEDAGAATNDSTRAPSPGSEDALDKHPGTQAEIALAKMWPMRYLGIHCRVEDALQYDDRAIYPRASSRLGPRHQANITVWHGRPVELVKPAEIKKKYIKSSSHKKDAKLSKETIAALEADRAERAKRPKWVLDEPVGYVHRGEDYPNDDPRNTAQLLFKMPIETKVEEVSKDKSAAPDDYVEQYLKQTEGLAKTLKVASWGANLRDKALAILLENNYDAEKALKLLAKVHRSKDLKEPVFTMDELKTFEEGVGKYGSEHRLIRQHMKNSQSLGAVIRFYYLWKKTPRGQNIWGNYGGRKGVKKVDDEQAKIQAEVADDVDDSAFDSAKAVTSKRIFQCKFCKTHHSRQWRRAPGVSAGQTAPQEGKSSSKEKATRPLLALCLRCSSLWRRYAIQWEDIDEVAKKVAAGGGRAWKKRIDEELLRELMAANELSAGVTPDPTQVQDTSGEPPKKKSKTGEVADKKKEKPPPPPRLPTPPPPPIVPEQPRWRPLPCAVCKSLDNSGERPISCTHCKLSVHKQCYGLADQKILGKWVCDQCTNDRNPVVSTDYACTLCPIEFTPQDLWEHPKTSHKKKTDRDREKERLEKELLDKAKAEYTARQMELGRAFEPREPLKRTDGNNWVHVICSVWTPEIKFSNADVLEKAEGFSLIPTSRYDVACKLCKSARHGACISCLQCHSNFHVACAFEAGYTFGFDVTPVKGSRKDQVTTVTMGQETGYLTAAVWCKDHTIKTIVHPMDEVVDDSGKTALQLYVESYKQADRTLTGTARKANLLSTSTRVPAQTIAVTAAANRRVSTVGGAPSAASRKGRNSIASGAAKDEEAETTAATTINGESPYRKCVTCHIDVSPKWWPAIKLPKDSRSSQPNGERIKSEPDARPTGSASSLAANKGDQSLQCHKCHWRTLHEPERLPKSPGYHRNTLNDPPTDAPPAQINHPPVSSWSSDQQPPPQHAYSPHYLPQQQMDPPYQTMTAVGYGPSVRGYPPAPNGMPYGPPIRAPQGYPPGPPMGSQYYPQRPPSFSGGPPPHMPNGAPSPQYHPSMSVQHGPPPPQQQQQPPAPYVQQPQRMSESPYPPGPPSQPQQQQHPHPTQQQQTVQAPPPQGQPHPQAPQQQAQPPPQPQAPSNQGVPGAYEAQHPTYAGQHGSPNVGFARPSTPRESSTSGEARPIGGASASPSVRNLLS